MAKTKKNEKRRERRRINAFDVVIVLLILCLIATFAYRVYDGIADPTMKKDPKYVLTFECDEEYISLTKYLENGEAVYFESNGELLGHLYSDAADASVLSVVNGAEETESGESTEYVYERVKLSGMLKLNADAAPVADGIYYTVGETNIAKGSTVNVYTSDTVFTLKVVSITEIR